MNSSVEILGIGGHAKCEQLKSQVKAALKSLKIGLPIREITDLKEIVAANILTTPALRINGRIVLQQVVPNLDQMTDLLKAILSPCNKTVGTKKIIVPTDFSSTAKDAFKFALGLSKYYHTSIKAVHAYTSSFSANDTTLVTPGYQERQERLLDELNHFTQTTKYQEQTATSFVEYDTLSGSTVPRLLDLSTHSDTELIVMGTTGKHGLAGRIFGTVSTAVAQHAKCPVLLVPNESIFRPFQKILIASDYLTTDSQILEKIVALSTVFHAKIHFVHVQNGRDTGDYQVAVDKFISKLFEQGGPSFSFQLTSVKAASIREGLNNYMRKVQIDLCIFAAPKQSLIEQLVHKNPTKALALYAECPLMIYHPK